MNVHVSLDSSSFTKQMASFWLTKAVVQYKGQEVVETVEEEVQRLESFPHEMVGLFLEKGIRYVDSVTIRNITRGTTTTPPEDGKVSQSPVAILWIILGTVCLFTLLIMVIQRCNAEFNAHPDAPFESELTALSSFIQGLLFDKRGRSAPLPLTEMEESTEENENIDEDVEKKDYYNESRRDSSDSRLRWNNRRLSKDTHTPLMNSYYGVS